MKVFVATILIGMASNSIAQPAFEEGNDVFPPRIYEFEDIRESSFRAFLSREAYPISLAELNVDCTNTKYAGWSSRLCTNLGSYYRSRTFSDLVFVFGTWDGQEELILYIDDPIEPSVTKRYAASRQLRDFSLTVRVRRVAEQSNQQWSGRFLDEMEFRDTNEYLKLRHYSQYGQLDHGHAYNHYVAQLRVQSSYVFAGCHTCEDPVIEAPPSED